MYKRQQQFNALIDSRRLRIARDHIHIFILRFHNKVSRLAMIQEPVEKIIAVSYTHLCGSFSSTVFNHRTDEYGGSAENRARFAVEAVKSIRSRLPEIPIDYKLAVRQEDPHYGNAGVVESELGIFVPLLTDAGVTSFHEMCIRDRRKEGVALVRFLLCKQKNAVPRRQIQGAVKARSAGADDDYVKIVIHISHFHVVSSVSSVIPTLIV